MHAWASATAGVALLFFVGRNGADDNRKLCTFEEGNDCSLWNFTSSFRVVSNVSVLRLSEGIDPNEQILNSEFRGKLVQTNCQDFSNLMPLLQTANWINSTSTTSCALSFDLIIPEPSRLEAVEVILQRRGFRDHLLWSIADTSSSSRWSNHRIVLGRLNEPFRILFESSCVANREFSSGPLLALDNLHFQDCFRRSMKNSICAEPDKFPCHPTGTCLDADVMCDFSADCPDRSDEQDILCGARCDFEKGMCLWTLQQQPEDSLSIAGNNTWSRTSARAAAPSAGLVMDHTTKTPGGFLLLLDMAQAGKQGLTGVGQLRSPVFPRMPLPESSSRPAGSCKVTFYYISSGVWTEGSVALMVHQVSGTGAAARDTIWQLRHRTESRANSADWKRVTVPITDLRSRYFLRFVGVHGVSNGHFAVDDISLSRACFFRGLNSTTSIDDDREYDFQFEKQFSVTNCGKSGPVGPAEEECRSLSTARAVSVLGKEEDVVFGGMGIQQWTVSTTGVYNITATGATGGGVRSTADGNACGGATVSGSFRLQAGEVVRFAVGQRGLPACTEGTEDCGQGAGGGGATLVFKDSTKKLGQSELLLVAAGGSGHSSGTSRQTCSCMAHVPATLVEPLDAKYIVSLLSGESAKMEVQSVCLKTVVRDGGFGGGSPSCDYSSGAGGGTVSAGSSPSDQEKWSVVSIHQCNS
ncbi:putative MAM and LDL-receptor class A domain-containing protein 2 [Hypsibius exemplaris]|uniref:MAM and LDL-receptor class A domain-containing protein 2 n=1 Tax=Hypsibius exemplaris TaxID=2072580 RepID=A0A9X6NG53_HYPEX|nr:putative MAM and LDL-receptor class A domain-containing protein 2 [Hypsibius exemplaris]